MRTALTISLLVLLGAGCAAGRAGAPTGVPTGAATGTEQEPIATTTPDARLPIPSVSFDAPFTLKEGESVAVGGELRVTLDRLTDSRCPKGVQCIWAGELGAAVTVEVLNGGEKEELLLGETNSTSTTVFLREIRLVARGEKDATFSISGAVSAAPPDDDSAD